MFGNAHTHDRLIRELAVGTGAAVVFPNYSLSPEARYPTAIEECYAVAAWIWDQYTPDPARRAEITASPLRAGADQLAGLPPALVITAEADVLRDEGEAYAARLRAAGVPVTAVRYLGIIHDFVMLSALRETHAAEAAIAQAIGTLRAALAAQA